MDDRDKGFTEYFASRGSAFLRTAYLLCGNWHRAEDLVQTTFLKLYRAWHRIGGREVLDAYTRQILVRTYYAAVSLVKAGKYGSLGASVRVGANVTGTDATPCALSVSMLDPMYPPDVTDPNTGESCTEVPVAGKQVGVAVKPGKMLVAYLHSDGLLVILSQEALPVIPGYPGFTELPFTGEQLAELVVDPRFHLG